MPGYRFPDLASPTNTLVLGLGDLLSLCRVVRVRIEPHRFDAGPVACVACPSLWVTRLRRGVEKLSPLQDFYVSTTVTLVGRHEADARVLVLHVVPTL